MAYIELRKINKKFDNKTIFEDVSYTFEKGKRYGIIGRNGSGKSVLFKMISGLMYQDKVQW
ncbi:ATP-binding cassette domain-containing protein [Helcococcus kunzii]|uniref:ATP-binding cassette domain-containing protein n=1 Tax=Helcococcus kunzii TaxID=40091 RepID=UPI0024AC995E|nr:ATP-binding cassette domain-containing protein [Helcococcus kunzii]